MLSGLTRIRPRTIHAGVKDAGQGGRKYLPRGNEIRMIERRMPRPTPHYSLVVKDHVTREQLKAELIDLPFSDGRRFRVRVNGKWAQKLPVASKSLVFRQVRSWLVRR